MHFFVGNCQKATGNRHNGQNATRLPNFFGRIQKAAHPPLMHHSIVGIPRSKGKMQFKVATNYIRQTQEIQLLETKDGKLLIVGILIPTHMGLKLISRDLQQATTEGPETTGLMAWNYRLKEG